MTLTRIRRQLPYPNSPFRLFDQAFPSLEPGRHRPEASKGWLPAVDIHEDSEGLTFTTEVPGFTKEDLNISVEDGTLTLSGERSRQQEDEGRHFHRVERSYGRFERSFTLPTNVDPAGINASLKNGLLTISIPKREEAKPRQIAVNAQ
ncbi:MAG TPA: Hsp20/alpha crystallin family protein [Acidobacteriota bacterium]|nr:Hsp20/alpha crystallin family protein [Acidobacteriota bacterium]